jgi:hypothetical protein
MESTWQLELMNSTKSGSSTPRRKPAMPFVDLTNIQTERRREVRDLFYYYTRQLLFVTDYR